MRGISYTDCGENIANARPYPSAWAGVYNVQESMIKEPSTTGQYHSHLTSKTLHRMDIGVYIDGRGMVWFFEDMTKLRQIKPLLLSHLVFPLPCNDRTPSSYPIVRL